MRTIDRGPIFRELDDWRDDRELLDTAQACVEAQKRGAAGHYREHYRSCPDAHRQVGAEALDALLRSGADVHAIGRNPEISNVIVFNAWNIDASVTDTAVRALRERIDRLVGARVRSAFGLGPLWGVTCSGHFWYPPGGYMGWHTNSGTPDWRLYISYTEEPGKSFFRYRDVDSGEIVTSMDDGWNVRLFRVCRERPLWHSICSDTNRFSLGYRIHPWRPWKPVVRGVKRALRRR